MHQVNCYIHTEIKNFFQKKCIPCHLNDNIQYIEIERIFSQLPSLRDANKDHKNDQEGEL
jgi:hypothetical protein